MKQMTQTEQKAHRKFLRSSVMEYPADKPFPLALDLWPGDGPTDMSWIRSAESGAVLFVASTGCEACRLEPAIALMRSHPQLAYGVLLEGDEEALAHLRAETAGLPDRIFRCDIALLTRQTPIRAIPYMLVLRPDGTAAASGLFNTYEHAERLARSIAGRDAAKPAAE
ncbi:hypothetical protein H7C19_19690 [Cohnella nanjingensis]|uniref:Thioredoxin domain-containing protein n=2 Tax=Cohnella nanjingensis TaxID=1387779 RepID=A0A7X0VHQ6_9BACL|nr:hypothetical protein [Cohnella nanjingensis]